MILELTRVGLNHVSIWLGNLAAAKDVYLMIGEVFNASTAFSCRWKSLKCFSHCKRWFRIRVWLRSIYSTSSPSAACIHGSFNLDPGGNLVCACALNIDFCLVFPEGFPAWTRPNTWSNNCYVSNELINIQKRDELFFGPSLTRRWCLELEIHVRRLVDLRMLYRESGIFVEDWI